MQNVRWKMSEFEMQSEICGPQLEIRSIDSRSLRPLCVTSSKILVLCMKSETSL